LQSREVEAGRELVITRGEQRLGGRVDWRPPLLYLMKAHFTEFIHEELTRERVVPTISASILAIFWRLLFEVDRACHSEPAAEECGRVVFLQN